VRSRFNRLARPIAVAVAVLTTLAAVQTASAQTKTVQLPIRTDGPKSLDPAVGSTVYDNMACVQVYETLLENSYADPMKLEPRLLTQMPTSDDGGRSWRFTLKEGVHFQDDPCFEGGVGRPIRTEDVFYSLKRLADKANGLENWWLLEETIAGFDDFKNEQNDAASFDYDAPVEGFVKINDREFEIHLSKPVYRFLYIMSMFQTSIVPREAVEYYHGKNGRDSFGSHPVGTGPFVLDTWIPKTSLTLDRNPNYHEVLYPASSEWSRDDRRLRLHRPAGKRVPFVDRIEFTMFVQDQPMWLQFRQGKIGYTQVPAEYFPQAFNPRTRQLREEYHLNGVRAHSNALLDFIFRGFNMDDALVGGYSDEEKALRQAISLAIDLDEFNEAFYNGLNIVYDGPIPPGLDGHPAGGKAPGAYRGPNIPRAKAKLVEAGYPGGEGLPPIAFYTSQGGNNQEQSEMLKRQLREIGVEIDVHLVDFSTLIEMVNKRQAPIFGFAWSSDYPDAENNLALFYGPNEAPGSNHYNYKRADYDELYETILVMGPSPERTKIYEQMRDMIIEDVPYLGSMARERFYLINPWLLNARPTERYYSWYKYLDVDNSERP